MAKINLNFPKKVVTSRLLLRPTHPRELSMELDLLMRDGCDILTSFYEFPDRYITEDHNQLKDIKELVANQTLKIFSIFRKGNPNQIIGQIILDADRMKSPRIGFYTSKAHRRKGYSAEAHKAMISTIASLNPQIKTIWEEVVVGNNASRNLLIRNGFSITGIRNSASFGLDDKSLCLRRPLRPKPHTPC